MPLDYINYLYKLAIDREEAERKRLAEEEKKKKKEERLRQRYQRGRRGAPMRRATMTRQQAEAFEDAMEDALI